MISVSVIFLFWLPLGHADLTPAAQRAIHEYVAAVEKVQPKRHDLGELQAKIAALFLKMQPPPGRLVTVSSAQEQIDQLNKSIADWSSPALQSLNPYTHTDRLLEMLGHTQRQCCHYYKNPDEGREDFKRFRAKPQFLDNTGGW